MLRIKDKLPKLSKHFDLSEFIDSSEHPELVGANFRALKPRDMVHLQTLVRLLESLRSFLKEPIHINSGFRFPALNKAVSGVCNSRHTQGLAADISFGSVETLNRAYSYLSRRKMGKKENTATAAFSKKIWNFPFIKCILTTMPYQSVISLEIRRTGRVQSRRKISRARGFKRE